MSFLIKILYLILILLGLDSNPSGAYRGRWIYNPKDNIISGNPATSPVVEDLMKALKNKSGASGVARNHSAAMTILMMEKIYKYIFRERPTSVTTLEDKEKFILLSCFLAFSTTSFNL